MLSGCRFSHADEWGGVGKAACKGLSKRYSFCKTCILHKVFTDSVFTLMAAFQAGDNAW
jgi:hypothetical protein